MALFFMAMTINPGAKKTHDNMSKLVSDSLDLFSSDKVHLIELYATLGRYDYLALFEASDQTEAFKIAADINKLGILETETWPVVPYEDFTKIVG